MDYSPPGSSTHGILQAKTLEWVAFPFFWIQGSNPGLLHWRWILYRLNQQGLPTQMPASNGGHPKFPWGIRRGLFFPSGSTECQKHHSIQPVLHDCVSLSMHMSLDLYPRGHSLASMAAQDRRTWNIIHRRKKLGVDPDDKVPGQSRALSGWAGVRVGGSSLVAGVGKASNHFEH